MIVNKDLMLVMRTGKYQLNKESLRKSNDAGLALFSSIGIAALFLFLFVEFISTSMGIK